MGSSITNTFQDLYNLMPQLDCGLCGNPSCRTMTRKIITGDAKIEQCVNLRRPEYRKNAVKIRKILERGVQIGAKGTVVIGEEGITYIHPCISEAGRVTAESRLTSGPEGPQDLKYGFFDPIMMCWALSSSEIFKDVRCAQKLGIARVLFDDKTVMVFQDGRINVRRAKDRRDALDAIKLVARSLWGAIICSCCGNAGVDCASGGCEDCLTRVCPVLAGGPPDPTVGGRGEMEKTTGSTVFDRARRLKTGKYFEDGVGRLDKAVETFSLACEKLLNDQIDAGFYQPLKTELNEVNRLASRFIIETPRVQDASMGLLLAGVAMDISRMSEALNTIIGLGKPIESEKVKSLLRDASEIAVDAYQSFRNVNLGRAKQIVEAYNVFRGHWREAFGVLSEKNVLVAIEKIATNGFFIARLLTKPLPA